MKIFDFEGYSINTVYREVNKILKDKKILSNIYEIYYFSDEPKFKVFSANTHSPRDYSTIKNISGSKVSGVHPYSEKCAKIATIAEGVERFCSNCVDESRMFYGSSNDLKSSHYVVSPRKFLNYEMDESLGELEEINFHWEKVYSFFEGKYILLPSHLIYNSYVKDKTLIRHPISTGCSTWTSYAGSVLGGLYELIERDSFMIFYLNKLSPPKVDLKSINNKRLLDIFQKFDRYAIDYHILDVTTDLNVPTFLTVLIDRTGIGPAVVVGNDSDYDYISAIEKSILEAYKVRLWLRYRNIFNIQNKCHEHDFLLKRGFYWYETEKISEIEFLIKGNNYSSLEKYKKNSQKEITDKLEEIINILKEKNYDLFIKDFHDNKLPELYSFITTKVIVPQLHPLYLQEEFFYDKGERLNNVPLRLGYEEVPIEKNSIPHPFL